MWSPLWRGMFKDCSKSCASPSVGQRNNPMAVIVVVTNTFVTFSAQKELPPVDVNFNYSQSCFPELSSPVSRSLCTLRNQRPQTDMHSEEEGTRCKTKRPAQNRLHQLCHKFPLRRLHFNWGEQQLNLAVMAPSCFYLATHCTHRQQDPRGGVAGASRTRTVIDRRFETLKKLKLWQKTTIVL